VLQDLELAEALAGFSERFLQRPVPEVLFDRVAGLDIGQETLTCCVRVPGTRRGSRASETRTFKTTTSSLKMMQEWLVDGVTTAAMESTSTYWRRPFYCLEEQMTTWL
jgi:transposase